MVNNLTAESALNMVKKRIPHTAHFPESPILMLSMFPKWLEEDTNLKLDDLQDKIKVRIEGELVAI